MNNFVPALLSAALVVAAAVYPFERFASYTATLTVNDFAFNGDTVWIASSGGLYRYVRPTGNGTLYSNPSFFPDPAITAVYVDAKQNLWVASKRGFLTLRPAKGATEVFSNYATAGWQINDLHAYGRYLIVASNKGCSVFDTDKKTAIKNATGFNNIFSGPEVNAIAIVYDKNRRDTLLVLGCKKGTASLSLTNNNIAKANFFDPGIWRIDTTDAAPVMAFAMKNDSLLRFSTPGVFWNNTAITVGTDSVSLVADTTSKTTFRSHITTIAVSPFGECYIGTKFHYWYRWNGKDTVNVPLDGPVFTSVNRVYVDRDGNAWVGMGATGAPGSTSREGFSVCRGGAWTFYSIARYPQMGEYVDCYGICEDPFNRIWFGTFGGHVKRFNKTDGTWAKYCTGAQDIGKGEFFGALRCHGADQNLDWAKTDGIALDSSGYLWITSWSNAYGSLICYDPAYEPLPSAATHESRHYRYFFPKEDPRYSVHVNCVCVDAARNIIVGDGVEGAGRIQIFRHNGNPLRDGLEVVTDFTEPGRGVYDAAATNDSLTYLATTTGFYTYNAAEKSLRKGLYVKSMVGNVRSYKAVDSNPKEIRTVEIEDERILWLGTASSGVIRYDLLSGTSSVIDESFGLLSNKINDLSIDRKNGLLWIATDRGLSRYSIGYAMDKNSLSDALVYPNPYSKRRHLEVVFSKLPARSTVQVYSMNGTLLCALSPVESGATGSVCIWKPPRHVVPGMYLFTIRSAGKVVQGKLMVTP